MPKLTAGGAAIPWTLRRNRRAKWMRIRVRSGGVEVVAPPRTPRAEIDAFVAAQRDWIRAKVAAWRERAVEDLPERFETGGRVLLGGSHWELVVEPAACAPREGSARGDDPGAAAPAGSRATSGRPRRAGRSSTGCASARGPTPSG